MAGTRDNPFIDLGMPVELVQQASGKYALKVAGTIVATVDNSALATILTAIDGHVDGLEGFTDGIEALLTSIHGDVDGVEALLTSIHGDVDGVEALLTAISGKLPATLGQKAAAASMSVVLNSDPDARPASDDNANTTISVADSGTSAASGQDGQSIVTGAPTASSFLKYTINGQECARIQVTGNFVGALTFEISIDAGTTYTPCPVRVLGGGSIRSDVTANGVFLADVAGATQLRVRAKTRNSGTATVAATFSGQTAAVQVMNSPLTGMDILAADATFAVPSGTTYAGSELFANSGTAGSVVAISFTPKQAKFFITGAGLKKTGTGVSAASFRMHFFTSDPTSNTGIVNGDNAAYSIKNGTPATGAAQFEAGTVDFNVGQAYSDGAWGRGGPTTSNYVPVNLGSTPGQKLYALIETRDAYVPTNGETITPFVEIAY